MAKDHVPPGFERHPRRSPMTEPWEPIYSRATEKAVIIGLRAGPAHLNSRGIVHGGLLTTLADNAMGLSCGLYLKAGPRLLTASLTVDFLSVALPDQWIEIETTFVKPGRAMCFAQAFITADTKICARANAIFRVIEPNSVKTGTEAAA